MKKSSKPGKTKILAIGDVHGDTGLMKKLAEKAKKENVDLIVLAGDITHGEKSVKGLIGPFSEADKPVLIVPGNHESIATVDFLSKAYENAVNLHGYGHKHGDIGFFGAGTANLGIHQIPDREIFGVLKKGHSELGDVKKKIMVTHIHPYGSQSDKFGFPGSFAVRKAIEAFKPHFAINAHIHEAGGIEEKIKDTRIFNVSRFPRIFEV